MTEESPSSPRVTVGAPFGAGPGSLLRDDRGVMVVVGIILCFFMIGTVWYVAGIGNVIAYREQLQNATDASAIAGAIYDARGMNLLALINIIMGFAMSLIVLAKIMQVMFWISTVNYVNTCSGCGFWCPECCLACPVAAADIIKIVDQDVGNYVGGVESDVRVVLEAMHYTEEGIAVIWPWVAGSKSQIAGTYYANGVAMTTSFAYSQIPMNIDRIGDPGSVQTVVDIFSDGSLDPLTSGIGTTRLGLPVNSAPYLDLCKMGIIDLTSLDGVIPPGIGGQIAGLLAEGLYQMSEFFCDAEGGGGFLGPILEAIEDVIGGLLGMDPNGLVGTDDHTYSPMQLYDGNGDGDLAAQMGDGYFGVWATGLGVWSNALDLATPGLKVAQLQSHTNTVIGAPPADATLGVALAEFYYDPKDNEHGAGAQSNETNINFTDVPTHNVLYNMRWRARLRRYHAFPTVGVFAAFSALFEGNIEGAAKFAGETAAGYANSLLMQTAIGDTLSQYEGEYLSASIQNILDNGGAAPNSVTDTIQPTAGIDH